MTNCSIDLNQLYSALNNPASQADFLNPDYVEPTGPLCSWSILIFHEGTGYEFAWFYASQSMSITLSFGERGQARFVIEDYDEDATVMPFIPVEEMYVEVWNRDQDYLYFAGYTRDVLQGYRHTRADGTEAATYTITCTDLFHELERCNEGGSVNRVYQNKTLGFILRDVINRYTVLDGSDIDPALGYTVESFPIAAKTPAQVLQQIMELTGTTWVIEPGTKKVKLLSRDDGAVRFPVQITEDNKYSFFDYETFSIRRQNDTLHNQVEFWFNEKYTRGTVNVSQTSNIVVGHGASPETDWDALPGDLSFKLSASSAIYRVEKNLSSGLTQELRLSSAFAEATATNQAYELRGRRRRVFASDAESIGMMRTLGRGTGIFNIVMTDDGNAYTFAEARIRASGLLTLSRPLPQGSGETDTWAWPYQPLLAGMVLSFNLPTSKRFVGDVIVQTVQITDIGGEVAAHENPYGQAHPKCKVTLTWTATLTKLQAQLRKAMQAQQQVKVDLEQVDVEDYRRIPETFVIKECLHTSLPTDITETVSLTDAVAVRTEEGDPLAYYELDYYLNEVDFAFYAD